MNRRKFILDSTWLSAGWVGAAGVTGSILASCGSSRKTGSGSASLVSFSQAPLPYTFNALEPAIDAATMDIHYSRHAAAYTRNMNEAIAAEGAKYADLESLLASISKHSEKLRNNAGGHYNHERFWQWMVPGGRQMSGEMAAILERSFGSINDLKNQFNNAASQRFGSGWAWLYIDKQNTLKIGSTPNQDNPLMDISPIKGYPILGIDVWEHAYYLKYQNKRADYIAAWWSVVNWAEVEKTYNRAMRG
ncbi:MAG TPA: superoxide dismutase [Phnomibacter sp.]|nr:superoxide dismutase [Phnomibacter sp.]